MKLSEIKISEEVQEMELADFFDEHCAPLAKELGLDEYTLDPDEVTLWRGIQLNNAQKIKLIDPDGVSFTGYIKNVRTDRIPLDTHSQLSDIIDDMFEEKFGWRARSESVFCFGNQRKKAASQYGTSCKIYPMGEFKYVWSPKVVDLTIAIPSMLRNAGLPNLSKDSDKEYTEDQLLDFYEILSDKFEAGFTDKNLNEAMNSGVEILIKCKQYLAIPY